MSKSVEGKMLRAINPPLSSSLLTPTQMIYNKTIFKENQTFIFWPMYKNKKLLQSLTDFGIINSNCFIEI